MLRYKVAHRCKRIWQFYKISNNLKLYYHVSFTTFSATTYNSSHYNYITSRVLSLLTYTTSIGGILCYNRDPFKRYLQCFKRDTLLSWKSMLYMSCLTFAPVFLAPDRSLYSALAIKISVVIVNRPNFFLFRLSRFGRF